MKYFAAAAAVVMAVISLSGCGRKGAIIPPGTVIPGQVRDLRAEPAAGTIVLVWTMPSANTDESPLADLDGFDILRANLPEEGEECDCKYEVVAHLYIEAPGDAVVMNKRVSWPDRSGAPVFGSRYGYMVRGFNTGGYRGPDSNPATLVLLAPPHAPEGLTATPGDGTVALSWRPVAYEGAVFAGYNIYRADKADAKPARPLNRQPVTSTEYTESGLENGKELRYRVTALAGSAPPYSEGPSSSEAAAVPVDKIPPETPTGLQAVPAEASVLISWLPVTDTDLTGYILYRKGPGDGAPAPLPGMPTTLITYTDGDVKQGMSYEYRVSAVDDAALPNESGLSETAAVVMPVPDAGSP